MRTELTAERLRELLHYDAETGVFTRKVATSNVNEGDVAGTINRRGYSMVGVGGRLYASHRLAWLWVHGRWPEQIDHRNGVKHDNRLSNLRECTQGQNNQNRASTAGSTSKHIGVSWDSERQMWSSQIWVNGKKSHLGRFNTEDEAASAYRAAKSRLHTFNPVPRMAYDVSLWSIGLS